MVPAGNLVERWVAWKFVIMTWLSVTGSGEGCCHFRRANPHHIPLQGQDPKYQLLSILNNSSFFLRFVSFFAALDFHALKSQVFFEMLNWFSRVWDDVKLRVHYHNRCYRTLGTLNYWISQLHGRQLSFFLFAPMCPHCVFGKVTGWSLMNNKKGWLIIFVLTAGGIGSKWRYA